MNQSNFWLLKIHALLHVPPQKPFNMKNYEQLAQELKELLNISSEGIKSQDIEEANQIALSSDRFFDFCGNKGIGGVDFKREAYLAHPLSGEVSDLSQGRFLKTQINDAYKKQSKIR